MLKTKLFASIFFVVIFASVTQAELLNADGATARVATSSGLAASNYPAFPVEARFGLFGDENFSRLDHSGFPGADVPGTLSSDKKNSSSISAWRSADFNAPLSVEVFDVAPGGNLDGDVVSVGSAKRESHVANNFKAENKIIFSNVKYLTEDNFIFTKKISKVPDPSSFFLLGVGILALAAARRNFAS